MSAGLLLEQDSKEMTMSLQLQDKLLKRRNNNNHR